MSPMGIQAMKVHQLVRGFREHDTTIIGCKRLRPLAPKLSSGGYSGGGDCDLKSFIRPESEVGKLGPLDHHPKRESAKEAHLGVTRWNPTQEQIGLLEMLYRGGGMRTPNTQQIEQITLLLRKYGKIEGKNVFYWFQNHKARERQKQKRISLSLGSRTSYSPSPSPSPSPSSAATRLLPTFTKVGKEKKLDDNSYKRKCKSWEFVDNNSKSSPDDNQSRTLKLFPLHPEP